MRKIFITVSLITGLLTPSLPALAATPYTSQERQLRTKLVQMQKKQIVTKAKIKKNIRQVKKNIQRVKKARMQVKKKRQVIKSTSKAVVK